ncbi:MAG: family 43 glycosylhydrolase [Actinobacteria bacterium]|nr:family 43 glycosylhydrolase [Actinomycetota bacterium]
MWQVSYEGPGISRQQVSSLSFLIMFLLVIQADAQIGDVTQVHDPCIIKSNNYYYIFSTGKKIPIRRSKDLIEWEYIGSVFDAIPDWGIQTIPGVKSIWGPNVFYHEGRYYLFYALSGTFGVNRLAIGVATNTTLDPDDPGYRWIDHGKVIESKRTDNWNTIGPNIVMDDSGKIWMAFGSFWDGIKLTELDSTTMKPVSASPVLISLARRITTRAIEAPFIVGRNGYYYLFVSFDFCCRGVESTYKIMVGRSVRVEGTYYDRTGKKMLYGGGSLVLRSRGRWRGPGSNAVLLGENGDWLIYHTYDADNYGIPTLQIRSLEWDAEGWPVAGGLISEEKSPETRQTGFVLYQNYPNPFKLTTQIEYELFTPSTIKVSIYNVQGKLITTLVDGQKNAGNYSLIWDSSSVSSGLYFCQLTAGKYRATKKLAIVK